MIADEGLQYDDLLMLSRFIFPGFNIGTHLALTRSERRLITYRPVLGQLTRYIDLGVYPMAGYPFLALVHPDH